MIFISLHEWQTRLVMLVCVWCCLASLALAQPEDVKFGQVSKADFEAAKALKDTASEAIVLYDLGDTRFSVMNNDIWINEMVHERIYIQKKSGYNWATIQLFLRGRYGTAEQLIDAKGITYNLVDGKVVQEKLTKEALFTERVSDEVIQKKFTLPSVREGSIIEFSYRRNIPFSLRFNPQPWRFQRTIPVVWSEYRFLVPNYFFYKIIMGGYFPLAINENKQANVSLGNQFNTVGNQYRFVAKNLPAFRDEPYITTDEDYISRIEFEMASYSLPGGATKNFSVSWEDIDKTLLENDHFGGQLNKAGFLKEVVALAKAQKDTMTRLMTAYDYLRKNVKWNGRANLYSAGSREIFKSKEGDAADINLMLIALLREIGFETHPVILSTRSNGKINQIYPLLRQFNYVVAQVTLSDNRTLLLDATDPYLKPGMLPPHCLNEVGRLVHPTSSRFVSLAPEDRDSKSTMIDFAMSPEGDLKGTLNASFAGYASRSQQKDLAEKGQEKFLEEISKTHPAWQISKADFPETDPGKGVTNINYTLEIPEACMRTNDRLYLRPLLTEAVFTNPLKSPERLFPVDFGTPKEQTYFAKFTLPPGYQVEQLPKNTTIALPQNDGRFVYQTSVTNNTLSVMSRLIIRKSIYSAQEYHSLREFFAQVVAKHAEQIVLKKVATTAAK